MKHSMRLFFCVIVLSAFFFGACSNGVDSMVENYNGNFSTEKAVVSEGISVYDDDFSARDMLADEYILPYDTTLIIPGPKDAKAYRWTVVYVDGGDVNTDTSTSSFLKVEKDLLLYVPDEVALKKWAEYELTLVVTVVVDGVEVTYTDTASLVIY